jgi:hypothetical protein
MARRVKTTPVVVSQRQYDNIKDALEVMWPSVPEANVVPGLRRWREEGWFLGNKIPTCATLACFGGWCAWWPRFRAQGVRSAHSGAPVVCPDGHSSVEASRWLFGYDFLFSARAPWERGTSHEIVRKRLENLLARAVVDAELG